jgi:hypothetical protein
MSHRRRVLVPLGVVAVGLLACKGSGLRPASDATDRSALGAGRCTAAAGGEPQLFLVDWDATDLTSFEAKAGRDVVFVKYEGCQMKVLHGCSDDGIAGRYGTYGKPEVTSGSIEELKVSTTDELNARLPLGAVTFGGALSRGKSVEMKYHVSGVVNATRGQVFRGDLKANPRCEGATHFVSLYHLGAFLVGTSEAMKASGGAAVGGVGADAKHSEEASSLKRAGDLASCSSFEKLSCKAPIRVLLRPIAEGDAPATDAPVAAVPPGSTAGQLAQAQAMMNGAMLRNSAEQKLMAGDASGCLQDIDRSLGQDRKSADPQLGMLRARCEMRAGKCEDGKAHYRESKAAWARQFDRTGLTTDATIQAESEEMARANCPSAAAGGVPLQVGAISALQKILQASAAGDSATCLREGQSLDKMLSASPNDPFSKQAAAGLKAAAVCAGKVGKCPEARALYRSFSRSFFGDESLADAGFKSDVPSCAK